MAKRKVQSNLHPELGEGFIVKINTYKQGTPEYQKNTHYKVYFPKDEMYLTLFKKDLVFIKE